MILCQLDELFIQSDAAVAGGFVKNVVMKFSRGDGTNETTTTTTTAAPTTTVAGDDTADGDNAQAVSTNTTANATDDTDDNSERRKRKVEVTTTTSTTTTPIVYNSYFVKVHLETQFKYSNITKKEFKVFFVGG